MSTRLMPLAAALAVAFVSLPAAAGSWPNLPARKAPARTAAAPAPADAPTSLERYRYFANEEKTHGKEAIRYASGEARTRDSLPGVASGFVYVGGDAGWELAQHKYVWSGGAFAHSDECDHAIRTAKAPTADELEQARKTSPGA